MEIETVLSILTTLGVGSLIGARAKTLYDKRAYFEKKLSDVNEEKYRTILIYMAFALKPENRLHFIMRDDVLLTLSDDELPGYALDKLREYAYHSLLYASDEVIIAIREFIKQPTRANYVSTAIAMRKHLWGSSTKLIANDLEEI